MSERRKVTYIKNPYNICQNCGCSEALELHHIVPLAIGGHDIISNTCILCSTCHLKLHNILKDGKINHSELIIYGLNSAKAKGKKLGRPATGVPKDFIKEYTKFKNGDYGKITAVQFAKLQGIAISTYYKYASLINKETRKNI